MKKTFTACLAMAMSLSLSAEEFRLITLEDGIPGQDGPQPMGLGISADGRYICGAIDFGEGIFAMDLETGLSSYQYESDSSLRNIDLKGTGIGYLGDMGVVYSWNGEMSELPVPDEEAKYVLGEDLTDDGIVKVGSIVRYGYVTHAAYSVNGGEWKELPVPADDTYDYDGSSAKDISGDGKYIIGHSGSFGPILLWTRNGEGSYDVDALYRRFCALDASEVDEKPLAGLQPSAISNNGLYILCKAARYESDEDGDSYVFQFPAVYNTATGELKLYDERQAIDEYGVGLTGSSIADDGSFVGIIGESLIYNCFGSFIMKAGETQAELCIEAFPKFGELFAMSDMMGYSAPTSMSADGRYILGYGFYSDDFYDEESPAYFITYLIDTRGEGTAVSSVAEAQGTDEIFSIDGVRVQEMKKGINIVRMADGSVRKVMKK